jgi:ubiquinone/menaquinone biosynthesis C-methylase UbiE
MLSDPDGVLAELHRVMKPSGVLSVLDPHMPEPELVSGITRGGLFRLAYRGEKTLGFRPVVRPVDDLG